MARKNKHKFNGIAALVISCSILFIALGVTMAVNSCAENEPVEMIPDESVENSAGVLHYPGLETVTLPEGIPSQIKEYTGFTVSFNKDNHTPNYVAWELLGTEVSNNVSRSDNFWRDEEIEGCPEAYDYRGSGYDRGHLCPAADQKWSEQAMFDCFVMANMCPQDHALNAGAWNTLENKERQWAQRDSAIVIVAGPIYTAEDREYIGDKKIRVPGAFFKAIIAPYLPEPRGIAFVYPNMSAPGNMQDYSMSIDELENILGYDLFPSLPDKIENKIESVYSFREWNR